MNRKFTNRILSCVVIFFIIYFLGVVPKSDQAVILYESSNKYGPIWVYDLGLKRCLSFVPPGKVIQSCMTPSAPNKLVYDYSKMMLGTLYINKNPKKILMIGLGGGSIAKALHVLLPSVELDIVEINPDIPEIAKRYFAFQENDNTKIFVADGFEFVKNSAANSYDIIIVDAFAEDYVPPSFLTLEFLKNVNNILKKNGVVAVNTFNTSKYYELESELYKKIYGQFFNLVSLNNRIIISRKGDLPSFEEIKKQALEWQLSFSALNINEEWLVNKFIEQK